MAQPLTLIEKLATKHAATGSLKSGQAARSGDIITIRPKHVMTHDNTSAVMSKFKQIGATRIHDPRQPVFAIDHDIQNKTPENLGKYAKIESFARQHGIDFYPAGTGISHQVMVQEGYVTPGSMVVGSDSHSNLYGAACCLGTPVVRTDAASLWATGVTWWQVPPVARCALRGRLQPGVVGKDVIIALCGLFNHDEVLNMAVEFTGDGVSCLSMDQRMSIANMTTEWGALVGLFPFDEVLRDYLHGRADYLGMKGVKRITRADVDSWWSRREELKPDAGATYAVELELDLSTVIPHVSGPDDVKTMTSLPEIEPQRVRINKAYLLSCVNARLEDLREAASIINGHKVSPGVEFYVAAASAEVQKQAEADGTWQTLVGAGAIPLPSGCGPCIGLGIGTLKAGEVGISATNRNFKGRMGDRDAKAYLGSPAVVAASAIAGYICAPPTARFPEKKARFSVKVNDSRPRQSAPGSGVEIIDGFPASIRGRAIWLPIDNLNTDGIYSGKLTYRDDVPPAEMAAASFNNYDPEFVKIAKRGDIVVSGRNFGTGSSREQAATCLQHFGIPAVIAFSFSETYKRNAFNNGLVVFECPALVEHLEALSPSPPGRGARGEGDRAEGRPRTGTYPLDPDLVEFARKLRQEQSDAESLIWYLLRDRRLGGHKFRRQHPVEPYVLDFYCPDLKITVELDGGQHNEPGRKSRDVARTRFLQSQGIRVLRFWNHDVLADTTSVLEAIWNALHEQGPSPLTPLPEGEGRRVGGTHVAGDIEIDYRRSVIRFDGREFSFPPLSPTAQQLVVAGGAENVVRKRLAATVGAT
jgi:homoaconitate hydratase